MMNCVRFCTQAKKGNVQSGALNRDKISSIFATAKRRNFFKKIPADSRYYGSTSILKSQKRSSTWILDQVNTSREAKIESPESA